MAQREDYSFLERKVNDERPVYDNSSYRDGLEDERYKSKSERIIGSILNKQGVRFVYEDRLYVEEGGNGDEKGRLWYPDFHLSETGVIVEYVGKPDDKEYMAGIERKKLVYERLGINVVWIQREDIWEVSNGKYRKRKDAEENVMRKIYSKINESGGEKLKDAQIDAKARGYGYRTDVRIAA